MRVIKLNIEITNERLDALKELLGGEEELLDELEEAAKARLRELLATANGEVSQSENAGQ